MEDDQHAEREQVDLKRYVVLDQPNWRVCPNRMAAAQVVLRSELTTE